MRVSRNFVYQPSATVYQRWHRDTAPTAHTLQTQAATALPADRTFTILVQFENTGTVQSQNIGALHNTLNSLLSQTCRPVQCLISAPETQHQAIHTLTSTLLPDAKVISVSDTWPELLAARGALLCVLNAGEVLRADCLWRVTAAWQENTTLLYSDHDQIDPSGKPVNPWFTTEWSPDLLHGQNYIGHVFFADTRQVAKLSALNTQTPAWRYSLLLELGWQQRSVRCKELLPCCGAHLSPRQSSANVCWLLNRRH